MVVNFSRLTSQMKTRSLGYKLLASALQERKLVSIYLDRDDPDMCNVGYVLKLSKNMIILESVNSEGAPDGILLHKISEIYKVETGSKYEKSLSLLEANWQDLYRPRLDPKRIAELTTIEDICAYAKKKEAFITIVQKDDDDQNDKTGFITEMNGDEIVLNVVTRFGEDDGTLIISYDKISTIGCDGIEERKSSILYKIHSAHF